MALIFSPFATSAIHGKRTSAALFAFLPQRVTISLSPFSSFNRQIRFASKSSLSTERISGRNLNKICCVENFPQEQSVISGEVDYLGFNLSRRILICALLSVPLSFISSASLAAANDSIRTSEFGVNIAMALKKLGWIDEAVVFFLATLPVIELRGAIPVGYWMQLDSLKLTIISVLGNMLPVPFIVLYLKKFAAFLSKNNSQAAFYLDALFQRAKEKAAPIEEFQWLGLMLFVAVPFPGTGAWTGAIIAAILDMPFWSAISANFFGVIIAGLLVNLLVNVGLKHAAMAGILLFFISTVMWSFLRSLKRFFSNK